jgi:hypothetical protein
MPITTITCIGEDPGLNKRANALLDEQRVALGLVAYDMLERPQARVVAEQAPQQIFDGIGRQRVELDLPVVPLPNPAVLVLGPAAHEQMGGSGAWFALEPVERPRGRLRRVRTHVYATLLTATRRPGALSPTRLSPHRNRLRGIR